MTSFHHVSLRNACPLNMNSIPPKPYLSDLHNNTSCFLWFRYQCNHLLPIRPVKLEWLIGVAYLPVPVCVLRRGRVQSFSPSPAPPQPGGVGNMKNWGELKMYHFATSLGLCTTKKVPLLWWNNRASEEEKAEENPLAEAEQNFKPCWVPVLFVGRALSLTSDSLSLCLARQFSRPPQHAGLALSPPSLISSFALPKQRAGWHVNSRWKWIILPASHPIWLI